MQQAQTTWAKLLGGALIGSVVVDLGDLRVKGKGIANYDMSTWFVDEDVEINTGGGAGGSRSIPPFQDPSTFLSLIHSAVTRRFKQPHIPNLVIIGSQLQFQDFSPSPPSAAASAGA